MRVLNVQWAEPPSDHSSHRQRIYSKFVLSSLDVYCRFRTKKLINRWIGTVKLKKNIRCWPKIVFPEQRHLSLYIYNFYLDLPFSRTLVFCHLWRKSCRIPGLLESFFSLFCELFRIHVYWLRYEECELKPSFTKLWTFVSVMKNPLQMVISSFICSFVITICPNWGIKMKNSKMLKQRSEECKRFSYFQ